MKKINPKLLQFFSALSDETRINILVSLKEKPKSVNDIHKSLGKDKITLSAVSHQLKSLSQLDIITSEKKGREKTYSLSNDFCWCMLNDAIKHFGGKRK